MLNTLKLTAAILAMLGMTNVALADQHSEGDAGVQKVNPALVEFHERYEEALVQTSERVWAANSYDYSAYGYIEGDDGIIVVDTGWFPGQAKRSIEDFREITQKPVVAIIYTHLHLDHYGGASAIMEGQDPDIPVYGPVGWENWVEDSFNTLRPMIFQRIFAQMGMLIPEGEDGTVGSGVGPRPDMGGTPTLAFPPNIEIDEYTELTISGVRVHIVPAPGDLNEHLFIWLPDDKVLFIGDVLAGSFPAVETVRFEAERDPLRQVDSYEKALSFNAEYVIGGHGRVLMGAEEVREVLGLHRDVTQFLVDQMDRLYVKGLSADEVIDTLRLPPAIVGHDDFQLTYHRLEWMLRTMHLKRAGFVGGTIDYVKLTDSEEAKRIVPLMGGQEAVRDAASEAINSGDYRWAARLATYAMTADESDTEARSIRQQAFLRIAQTTDSANERNYLLTAINDENGMYDWARLFSAADLQVIQGRTTDEVLGLMKVRFRAEAADNIEFAVRLNVSSEEEPRYFVVRNNTLFLEHEWPTGTEAVIDLPRATLDRIAANLTDWSNAMSNGEMTIVEGSESAELLASLIE